MDTFRVMLIDDTGYALHNCRDLLGDFYEVISARDPYQAQEKLEKMKLNNELPAVIILDLSLVEGPIDGLNLLSELREVYPQIPVVVWTKHALDYRTKALATGAKEVIEKHIEDERLEPTVGGLCKNIGGTKND